MAAFEQTIKLLFSSRPTRHDKQDLTDPPTEAVIRFGIPSGSRALFLARSATPRSLPSSAAVTLLAAGSSEALALEFL